MNVRQLVQSFDITIHELLADSNSVGDSMLKLIDRHAEVYPNGNWQPFYAIPYDHEIPHLQREWFPSVIENDPPASVPIVGLWFGLFHPEVGERRERATVTDFYVAGARQFELDASSDWAVSPDYFPEGRYAESSVLGAIHHAAYGPRGLLGGEVVGLRNEAEQYLALGYVAFALKVILMDVDLALMLGSKEPVGVALGWDSSSYPLYLGFVTRKGFQVRNSQDAIAGIKRQQEEFAAWFKEEYGRDP